MAFDKNELVKLITESVAAQSDFLERVEGAQLSREQLRQILLQRFFVAQGFVPFLEVILAEKEKAGPYVREVGELIESHLTEESSPKSPEAAHQTLWKRLLKAMGISESELEIPPDSQMIEAYNKSFLDIIKVGAMPHMLGAFFAREVFVPIEYAAYLSACEELFPDLARSDLIQLISHVHHDIRHADEVWAVLDLYVNQDPNIINSVKEGISAAMAIIAEYFREAYKFLEPGEPSF